MDLDLDRLVNPSRMHNKINTSPVRWSKCFFSPSQIYHKINLVPVR